MQAQMLSLALLARASLRHGDSTSAALRDGPERELTKTFKRQQSRGRGGIGSIRNPARAGPLHVSKLQHAAGRCAHSGTATSAPLHRFFASAYRCVFGGAARGRRQVPGSEGLICGDARSASGVALCAHSRPQPSRREVSDDAGESLRAARGSRTKRQ
jgi:hypothetical protein